MAKVEHQTQTFARAGVMAQTPPRHSPLVESLRGKIRDRAVLAAMRKVPRENFLDPSLRSRAGEDKALPIGYAQTTSQPFVIARMLEMARNRAAPAKVLEIGAGCGYQSALLGELCESVVSVERVKALAEAAKKNLRAARCENVEVIHGDGFKGHPPRAPYDAIVVCAETGEIPPLLVKQLSPQARLVMPLAGANGIELVAVNCDGAVISRREQVQFVPLLKETA